MHLKEDVMRLKWNTMDTMHLKGGTMHLKGNTMHLKGNTIHNVQLGKHAVGKDPAPRRRHFCHS